ncbi:tetratricopeptide repeat protein 17 isoform X1 [Colias croceus]|uniref:tetratricopeptide repeat protein 17 isoform X1 n=1 Tax=Colias crocea TaxID=72248 RepID=UPI001E27B1C7|nr:tetratricopeptide repeat protein 17 isoform X1 [Colias croceus]
MHLMKNVLQIMFVTLLFCSKKSNASSHWMVTESGLIQPRLDSPFEMARSYDLLSFLKQESRWDEIINLYHELAKKQQLLDDLWTDIERDTDLGIDVGKDENCMRAGPLNMIDWSHAPLEDGTIKNIPEEEFHLPNHYGPNIDMPDCKKISSLTFSMFAYEHLNSMIKRNNISITPEYPSLDLISPASTVDQFGHWLAGALRKNSSSWLHYNLAALFWRIKGNGPKALECCRRAVLYAPREYKDIAMLNLGSILYRAKKYEDAITILNGALDHDSINPIAHFILGNIYTYLGEFNISLAHYKVALSINPKMDIAKKHKYAALCHVYLGGRIKNLKGKIDKLREELNNYSSKESQWIKIQSEFLKTMKPVDGYDYKNVETNCAKMTELTGLKISQLKVTGDKYSLIKYFFDGPIYNDRLMEVSGTANLDAIYTLQRIVSHIQRHANMAPEIYVHLNKVTISDGKVATEEVLVPALAEESSDNAQKTDSLPAEEVKPEVKQREPEKKGSTDEPLTEYESGIFLYPSTMQVNRNEEEFDTEADWPSDEVCTVTAPNFPDKVEAVYPVFLPLENKGIRVKELLTDKIGVPLNVEHELPWHPPTCPHDKEKKSYKPQLLMTEVVDTDYLREKLLEYVSDGDIEKASHMQDAEIGHRIYVAMRKRLAPKWIAQVLASLYWRVRGNRVNALHCLQSALKSVHPKYKDVVLVSLGSVYIEMGHFEESLLATEEAFKMNLGEPATNFLLAELNMINKHRLTHIYHLKHVVRVEPGFMNGLARNLLNAWSCILKQVNKIQEIDFSEGDICTQVEPGINMVCEKGGENCHMTNIQCFSSHERTESSVIVKLLEQGDKANLPKDLMNEKFFEYVIQNTPSDRNDRLSHQANYDHMMKAVETVLMGCGPLGCNSLQPTDLSLTEEECSHHYIQLGYWLHIVSFKQLLTDTNLRLPSDIVAISPSNKKIPDCKLITDPIDDFYLERLSRIDTDGWEPIVTLTHQFAELFNYFDYVALGAKIAKYVETRPTSWVGALTASWWCGAGGHGACAVRCAALAHALAPHHLAPHPLRALVALLHMHSKQRDAKEVAYLSFYTSPKSKIESFLVALSHTYLEEFDQAVWMYRYSLAFDEQFKPAKACLHATMCLMFYGEGSKGKTKK